MDYEKEYEKTVRPFYGEYRCEDLDDLIMENDTNAVLFQKLTPHVLGALVAMCTSLSHQPSKGGSLFFLYG